MLYSATSVMMPHLNMGEQAALLQRLGYDGIEWRVRRVRQEMIGKGYSEWGEHKNDLTPENFLSNAARMKKAAADHGLAIAGIASDTSSDDLEQVKLLLHGAVACGAGFIRVGCPVWFDGSQDYNLLYQKAVDSLDKMLGETAGIGMKVVIEMHGGTIHTSASLAHRIVSHWPAERIGVIYDPQNMVIDGFETIEMAIDLLGPYLAHVHAGGHKPVETGRDDTGTVQWTWPSCRMQDGLYCFQTMLRKLKAVGYRGFISIEDFRSDPVEQKLKEGIDYLRALEAMV